MEATKITAEEMVKVDQVLVLDPKQELHFKGLCMFLCVVLRRRLGPFTDVVTAYLKLTNPSDRWVCFNVKTTAWKRYCVRPNKGLIEPSGDTTIAVMLQPVDADKLNDKYKHKFMIQTVFAADGDVNQSALWKEANPETIMESKLKCVFHVTGVDSTVAINSTAPTNSHHNSNNARFDICLIIPSVFKRIAEEVVIESVNDVKKIMDENKRLRQELVSIRAENLQLKEDRLKHRVGTPIIQYHMNHILRELGAFTLHDNPTNIVTQPSVPIQPIEGSAADDEKSFETPVDIHEESVREFRKLVADIGRRLTDCQTIATKKHKLWAKLGECEQIVATDGQRVDVQRTELLNMIDKSESLTNFI
ncbi:unnamed protein product [Medioppia subpectinata]|uniref:MSP domain-containing protein n=1 Tax=Medioppia subpectinata TaxID=1979941 RepID=A0A7R9KG17_9ACAR|nr:unnamed protein product [Medioppia subpectinata]CAG2102567.1 unnamed protein product [Medioppia subpectinata]